MLFSGGLFAICSQSCSRFVRSFAGLPSSLLGRFVATESESHPRIIGSVRTRGFPKNFARSSGLTKVFRGREWMATVSRPEKSFLTPKALFQAVEPETIKTISTIEFPCLRGGPTTRGLREVGQSDPPALSHAATRRACQKGNLSFMGDVFFS